MNKNKVSIVTVVYNGASYIEKTIQSVIQQDYPNLEYIVIDGKSIDSTLEIVNKYRNHIPDFMVLSEKDKGVYDAMNKGIDMATGEWIIFMNAGDLFYDSTVVSKIFESTEFHPNDAVLYGDAEFRLKHIAYINHAPDKATTDQYMPFSHQASFTRTNIAKKYKFDLHYKIAADAAFFLLLLKNGHQMRHVPFTICSYNALEGLSADSDVKRCLEIVELQGRLNGADITNKHFTQYIKAAQKRAFLKKIIPHCLWVYLREKMTEKHHKTYSVNG